MSTSPRHRARRLLALLGVLMAGAALALFVVGPGGSSDGPGDAAPAGEAGSRFRGETAAASGVSPTASAAALERRVAELVIAGFPVEPGPQRVWGGLLVTDTNYASPEQLRALVRSLKRRARREKRPEPLVFANPGSLGELGPRAQPDLGAEGQQSEARAEALAAARRVRTAGVDAVFAPAGELAVGGAPAEARSFGDDPRGVAAFVFQAVDGWRAGGVAPIVGRFPGEGAASQDPIDGPATVGLTLEELVARDVRPFAGVVARAPAIQMSAALYAAWDGVTPATLLPEAVGLLRGRLGYRGAVVSSDLIAATAATGGSVGKAAVDALKAGCDLLLIPGGQAEQDQALRAVVDAVRRRQLAPARVDEALRRLAAFRKAAGAPT